MGPTLLSNGAKTTLAMESQGLSLVLAPSQHKQPSLLSKVQLPQLETGHSSPTAALGLPALWSY